MGIKAVINGKLNNSRCTNRSEDLLTSNIFQNISYLPYHDGLKFIIDSVKNLNNDRIALEINETDKIIYKFWEKHKSCEPDLIIEVIRDESIKYVLMIEMKYLSKKSSNPLFNVDELYIDNSDQLQKEYSLLHKLYKKSENYFLYVTKEVFPYEEIIDSENAINKKNVIYHANYMQIYKKLLEKIDNPIIYDILQLFEYLNMESFSGWNQYEEVSIYINENTSIKIVPSHIVLYDKYQELGDYKWI